MSKGIQGLDELMRQYGELAEAVVNESMERAVGRAVKLIQGNAKMLCPVNDGELRNSIKTYVESVDGYTTGEIYTNKKYAPYVEFGTGPKGESNHSGISPVVEPAYTQSPWWIHEGNGPNEIDRETAEKYHMFYIDTPDGRFYQSTGQPAQPFLYPALKDNEDRVTRNISNYLAREIRKAVT